MIRYSRSRYRGSGDTAANITCVIIILLIFGPLWFFYDPPVIKYEKLEVETTNGEIHTIKCPTASTQSLTNKYCHLIENGTTHLSKDKK